MGTRHAAKSYSHAMHIKTKNAITNTLTNCEAKKVCVCVWGGGGLQKPLRNSPNRCLELIKVFDSV